jgi:hypothetical protein
MHPAALNEGESGLTNPAVVFKMETTDKREQYRMHQGVLPGICCGSAEDAIEEASEGS